MSISDNYVPTKQIGDGSTVDFSGMWQVIKEGYERVYLENVTTGAQVLQVLTTDYTLVFDDDGFVVTFLTAPPATEYVVIGREVAIDQTNPYRTSKGYQGSVLESSLDKITAVSQDLQDAVNRSVKSQIGGDAITFNNYDAGKVLGWSASVSGDIVASANTIAEMEGAIASVTGLVAASGVKVSSNDTTVGFLNGKLVAGTNITFTENNDGANETMTLDIPDATTTVKGTVEAAETAEMTAGTADKFPDAAEVKTYVDTEIAAIDSIGIAKAGCLFDGTAASPITPDLAFNVASVTTAAAGAYVITWTNAFDSADYIVQLTTQETLRGNVMVTSQTASSVTIETSNSSTGTPADAAKVHVTAYGNLA